MTKDQFMKLFSRCQQMQQMLMGAENVNISLFVNNRNADKGPAINFLVHRKGCTPMALFWAEDYAYDVTKREVTAIYNKLKEKKLI